MPAIRLVSAIALLLATGASAHAAAPGGAGVERALPRLELTLTEIDYAVVDQQTQPALEPLRGSAPKASQGPSLARFLNAPLPYGKLLPQQIDDRGAGYRLPF